MKPGGRVPSPSALELVEESVHLLRRAPARLFAPYCAALASFALGLLFFWAHTTWFRPSGEVIAWGALGLVVLFAWLKGAQAEFCAGLLSLRLGTPPAAWSLRRVGRLAIAQMRVQTWALFVLLPALLLTVPFGWVWAYGQSATVMGEGERLHDESMAQAKLWPLQNHLGLLLLTVLAFCTWMNLLVAFFLVPWLANRLLGIENIFGFSGWWFFNTTFLASVTALTWLALDPLVKSYYVLRVFYGRARRTGEDIRVQLQLARRPASLSGAALLILILAFFPFPHVHAAAAPPPPAAVESVQLDRALDEVLSGANFRWRLRPPPVAEQKEPSGPVTRFFQLAADMLRDIGRTVQRYWRMIIGWYERHFSRGKTTESSHTANAAGAAVALLQALLYLFIGVVVLLLVWLAWIVWRQARRQVMPVLAGRAVTAAVPDLRDENVQAAMLPVDGWLALAREQAARGEWRLALRALYLAMLARLAAERLVTLAAFKTNLDYERELRRRALSKNEIVGRFVQRRRAFEEVWYGRAEPEPALVTDWMTELERPVVP